MIIIGKRKFRQFIARCSICAEKKAGAWETQDGGEYFAVCIECLKDLHKAVTTLGAK